MARYVLELPNDAAAVGAPGTSKVSDSSVIEYVHTGYDWYVDAEGYPAVRPPWGTIAAYDLNAGNRRWHRPLGVDSLWASRGDSLTGTINYGGPVNTAGGLTFVAATTDSRIRALSTQTGATLWEHALPFDGVATPAVYDHAGKQYILIAAGGGKHSDRRGDAYVAFALPD